MEKLDWDEACLRIEDYLRAHRVEPRERLLGLTLELLDEAKALHSRTAGGNPLATAMGHVTGTSVAWFAALAGDPARAARARLAFFASGRHDLFLQSALPEDFVAAIRGAGIEAGPALEYQSLIRKELDYGAMEDLARETWDRFSWGHVLRAFALWLGIFCAAWWAYVRFFS